MVDSSSKLPSRGGVVLLGIRGSGKTVFLSVMSHAFMDPGAFGLSLSGDMDTGTDDYTQRHYHEMRFDKTWPEATTENKFIHLAWSAKSGTDVLFTLDSLDCAGELIVKTLAPGLAKPVISQAAKTEKRTVDNPNSLNTKDGGETATDAAMAPNAVQLRECVRAASVVCLFINPADIDKARNAASSKDDALVRHRAMTRLLRAFLETPAGEGKHIVLAITQAASPGLRKAIDKAGGPRSYLLQNEKFLSTILRFRSVPVITVSAVNNTGNLDADGKPTPDLKEDGTDSSGLVEFFLAIGAACSEDLKSLDGALQKVRTAQFTLAKRRHDGNSAKDRLAAAKALRAAWKDYVSEAEHYLDRHRDNEMAAEWRRDTMAHLDEEERIILRWMVAEPVLDQALRKAADRDDVSLVSDKSCQTFRHNLAVSINAAINRDSENRPKPLEGYLRFCDTDGDAFRDELQVANSWLQDQLASYRANLMNSRAAFHQAVTALDNDEVFASPASDMTAAQFAMATGDDAVRAFRKAEKEAIVLRCDWLPPESPEAAEVAMELHEFRKKLEKDVQERIQSKTAEEEERGRQLALQAAAKAAKAAEAAKAEKEHRLKAMRVAAEETKAIAEQTAMDAKTAEASASAAFAHYNEAKKHGRRASIVFLRLFYWSREAQEDVQKSHDAWSKASNAAKAAKKCSADATEHARKAEAHLSSPYAAADYTRTYNTIREARDAAVAAMDEVKKNAVLAQHYNDEAKQAESSAETWANTVSLNLKRAAIGFGIATVILIVLSLLLASHSFRVRRTDAFALARLGKFAEAARRLDSIGGFPPFLPRSRYVDETLVRRWKNLESFATARDNVLSRKSTLLLDEAEFLQNYGNDEARLDELTQSLWASYCSKRDAFLAALPEDSVDPATGLPPESLDLVPAIEAYRQASNLVVQAASDLTIAFERAKDTLHKERVEAERIARERQAAEEEAARKAQMEKERANRVRAARQAIVSHTEFPDHGDAWARASERAAALFTPHFLQGADSNALASAWNAIVAAANGVAGTKSHLPVESDWRAACEAAQRLAKDSVTDEERHLAADCATVSSNAMAVCLQLTRLRSADMIRSAVAGGLSSESSTELLRSAGFDSPGVAEYAVGTLEAALFAKYPEAASPSPDGMFWKTYQGDVSAVQKVVAPLLQTMDTGLRQRVLDVIATIGKSASQWNRGWLDEAERCAEKARVASLGPEQWRLCRRVEQFLETIAESPVEFLDESGTNGSRASAIRRSLPHLVRVSFSNASPRSAHSRDVRTRLSSTENDVPCVYLASPKPTSARVNFSLLRANGSSTVRCSKAIPFERAGTTELVFTLAPSGEFLTP